MSGHRVLVVDDEPTLLRAVSYALQREGFAVTAARDAERMLEIAASETIDVIILDLMLPGLSGVEGCRRLRETSTVPVIMLTARDTEADLLEGLDAGADDFVTKPFSAAELVGRVQAIIRRRQLDLEDAGSAVLEVGALRIDFAQRVVEVDGRRVQLTPSELRLLQLLATRPRQVVTRRELMRHLWSSDHVGDEHSCEAHISKLRRKIEADPPRPRRIQTVRGVGYRFVP